jgi:hypothetical protein
MIRATLSPDAVISIAADTAARAVGNGWWTQTE